MFSSRWCSSSLSWKEFNLLYRNLIAEYLCCGGGLMCMGSVCR